MADDRKEGWEPWTPERERGGSGVGAFTGADPRGPGDHGLEARKREGATGSGAGAPQPEFLREGWGEGENYPPAQGPLGAPEDKAQD